MFSNRPRKRWTALFGWRRTAAVGRSGFGVSFLRDSDRNRLNENTLVSIEAPAATMRVVPGGPFRDVVDDGIFLSALLLTPLLNLVVDGQLYQFPNSEDGHYPSSDDNILEGNYISLPGSSAGKSHAGILVSGNSTRSRLIDNTIAVRLWESDSPA